ncbi:MAG: hypothetical protein K5798_00125 [Nitrosopumilus sp.]|uniref:hypothetical protein n=1 Tax=Nitrosopumilus sp. TaxID=2024843 RepID=UPI00242C9FA5|nr:hypothetical protein [Nitrosopumilus sp.]MCV0365657.1 hypothetical protein [Nitrosopumilus sp.]
MKFQDMRIASYDSSKTPENNFHVIYDQFNIVITELEFLNKTIPNLFHKYFVEWSNNLNKQIISFNEKEKEEFAKISKIQATYESGKEEIKNVKIQKFFGEQIKLARFSKTTESFVKEMGLVYLITQFEEFLKDTLRLVYIKNPSILKSSKKIEVSELIDIKDVEDIKNLAIENQIEDLLHEDIEEIASYLNVKLKINLIKKKEWKEFAERFYRRNILIHNDGIPNKLYHKKTNTKSKERLDITEKYFSKSLMLFEKISHDIAHYCEDKFSK